MFTFFLTLCNTISSVSPEIKINAQKRSIFHPAAHEVLDSQWKKRYFWMVPGPLVQQFKKKPLGLSGREWFYDKCTKCFKIQIHFVWFRPWLFLPGMDCSFRAQVILIGWQMINEVEGAIPSSFSFSATVLLLLLLLNIFTYKGIVSKSTVSKLTHQFCESSYLWHWYLWCRFQWYQRPFF